MGLINGKEPDDDDEGTMKECALDNDGELHFCFYGETETEVLLELLIPDADDNVDDYGELRDADLQLED